MTQVNSTRLVLVELDKTFHRVQQECWDDQCSIYGGSWPFLLGIVLSPLSCECEMFQ